MGLQEFRLEISAVQQTPTRRDKGGGWKKYRKRSVGGSAGITQKENNAGFTKTGSLVSFNWVKFNCVTTTKSHKCLCPFFRVTACPQIVTMCCVVARSGPNQCYGSACACVCTHYCCPSAAQCCPNGAAKEKQQGLVNSSCARSDHTAQRGGRKKPTTRRRPAAGRQRGARFLSAFHRFVTEMLTHAITPHLGRVGSTTEWLNCPILHSFS